MFRKIGPSNGYCLFFPNRRIGSKFVAGRNVRVGLFEEWKHVKLGLFSVLLPGDTPLLITTSEGLECDLKASFGIVIGGPEEGREERLEKATISCPPTRSLDDRHRIELVPFFRDWASNYCRTAILRTVRDCQYVRLMEEPEYRAKAEKDIEHFAAKTLAEIGMMLVQCTVVIEPREPSGVFATAEILKKWQAYKCTVNDAILSKLSSDNANEESRKLAESNHAIGMKRLQEDQVRKAAELDQETQVRLRELALELKKKESDLAIKEKKEESNKDMQVGEILEEMAARTQARQKARISREGELAKETEERKEELAELKRTQEKADIAHRQEMLASERSVAEKEVELLDMKLKKHAAEVAIERDRGSVKAENLEKEVLAGGAHDERMRKLFIDVLPKIAEQVSRPVEKIGEVRVISLAGQPSGDSSGANSLGSIIASASTMPVIRELFRFVNDIEGGNSPRYTGVPTRASENTDN